MKISTLFEYGPLPLCPPDIIHVISVLSPSLFFTTLLLPYQTQTDEQKMRESWQQVECWQ